LKNVTDENFDKFNKDQINLLLFYEHQNNKEKVLIKGQMIEGRFHGRNIIQIICNLQNNMFALKKSNFKVGKSKALGIE
jgi:hypothetical protein